MNASKAKGGWIAIGLLAVGAMAGGGFVLQRQEAAVLQRELGWLREEREALAKLRAENERLKAAQAPAAEVERLRADRAALGRLRGEVEAMKTRADKWEPSDPQLVAATAGSEPVRLNFRIGADGVVATDDGEVNFDALKERFRTIAAAKQSVDLRIAAENSERATIEQVKLNFDRIAQAAKEAGLRFTLQFERPRK